MSELKFVQIAVAPVFGTPSSGGLEQQTNELFALDGQGRVWRHSNVWGNSPDDWELVTMPSGHHSGRGGPTFRGYPKLRMVPKVGTEGTEAVCVVTCHKCGWAMERRASAIKQAERMGSSFTCDVCLGRAERTAS